MESAACAHPAALFGTSLPKECSPPGFRPPPRPVHEARFGDVALLAFLMAQCLDGVFTYVGVTSFGMGIEANPVIAGMMTQFGHGVGLTAAKIATSLMGICLHFRDVHVTVALLATYYAVVAVGPWTAILFF